MTQPAAVTFASSRWLFLRLLGVVYLIAFVSLAVQITGLVGEHGILPVGAFLAQVHERFGTSAYYSWPTLLWISPSDAWLSALCWVGAAASLLLIAGLVPTATAALLWLLYLSLTTAGQLFLEFQWDSLLLETGLLAILYAPLSWCEPVHDEESPAIVRWAIWLLAFKLTFLSGITKILSGDPTWANWTALSYHYETQPIPAWTSWLMYQLPLSVHYWTTAATLLIELGASWLIFLPPRFWRARLTACVLMILLQVGIGATGNYGFFNLLTIVLYIALLDDRTVGRLLPRRVVRDEQRADHRGRPAGWRVAVNVVAACIAVLSVMTVFREMDRTRRVRGPFDRGWAETVFAWVAPLNSVNGYGLFRVMTTQRPEIVIEVSADGAVWKEQEFKWKAGNVMRRPQFVEPHMPRLDWQMWFAALDPFSAQDWLLPLAERLLAGEPAVTRLLGPNPLEGRPRYVRLAYYQYHFTSSSERAQTRAWWKREFGAYLTEPIGADGRPNGATNRQGTP